MEKYDDHSGEYLNEADIAGCDGIIVEGELSTLYVVFDSEQIKSATDNIGLFDKKNPDIRYSLKNTSRIEEQNKKLVQENESLRKYTKSVGHYGTVSTIYNVCKIKKDSMPNGKVISMIGSKADILSTHSISPKTENVNKKFSLKSDRYDYSKTFAQQIEDYKNGKLPKYDTLIVGPTPEVLQNVGLNALPMTYGTGHLKDVLSGGKTDHDFGETLLKQLPEAIKKPVAVISSKSHGNTSLVAILDMQYKGKSIISSVVIDGYGRQNNEAIDSNAITSMHTRQNAIAGLLKDAVNDEAAGNTSVYYIDAKKATGLLQRVGLQLPKRLFRTDGYVHSIRNSDSNVKPKIENVTKATALLFSVNCMTKTIILL